MKPTEAEDHGDGGKHVSQNSDDKSVEPQENAQQGFHQTLTEENFLKEGENLDEKSHNGGEIDEVSQRSLVSDVEWVCKSPNDASSTAPGWPSINTKSSSHTCSLSAEDQAIVAALDLQLKALEACQEFLVGNAGSDCDEDDSDDQDEDELAENCDSEEFEDYKFFERVFAEDGDLRRYYKNNHRDGYFYCLVCGGIGKKVWKRFRDCIALLQHSTAILRTKRKRAHRAYAQVICKVVGWDIDQLPAIAIKGFDSSLAGSRKLLVEPKKPGASHSGDSNGEPDKPADVHNDDSDVLQDSAVKV